MIVVDASVAVKWVTGEQDREAANALLDSGEQIAGPFLLRTEVVAAIARKARFEEITEADASAAVDLWAGIIRGAEIALFAEDADLTRSLKLSLELKHALQDCIYLALAERLDAPLITADEKFAAKARRLYPRVRRLTATDARRHSR
jgi:predicted nucleic acid-binding protein